MEIFCPHCQNQLAIDDEHAGEYVKCPLCTGMFTAPALMSFPIEPATSAAPTAPAPAQTVPVPEQHEVFGLDPEPQVKPPLPVFDRPPPRTQLPRMDDEQTPTLPDPLKSPLPKAPPPPTMPQMELPQNAPLPRETTPAVEEPEPILEPLAPGEYQHAFIVHFNPNFIRWVGPGLLAVVFALSFFAWFQRATVSFSLWGLAFAQGGNAAVFAPYVIFLMVALVGAIVSILLSRRVIVLPEPFKKLRSWRALVVAVIALGSFVVLFIHWLNNLLTTPNPMTLWYALALRLHFLAVVAFLIEFWLDRRDKKNLPLPKIELRW